MRHPNIVPVYSVHHREPFQVVCMPYLGWTTLHDVLKSVQRLDALPKSGSVFAKAIKKAPVSAPAVPSTDTPAMAKVARLSYVEAVVWLAAELADGLAHAHEQGIVHHDLKPANILLTDDGKPMLLDFNAAEDTKRCPEAATWWVAGTWPYMAPEQIAAVQGADATVDSRCDLFAFGVILFELLTGRYPFNCRDVSFGAIFERVIADRRGDPPHFRNWNSAVSPALEAIVRRCLESDPNRRYQTARDLCDDLQRQRDHRSLAHVAEPSRAERVSKWTRRHPRLLSLGLASLVAGILMTTLGTMALSRGRELDRLQTQERERSALQERRDQAGLAWSRFQEELKTAQFLLFTRTNEPEQRAEGIRIGMRLIESFDVIANPQWQQSALVQELPADDRQRLGDRMGELLLLTARALRLQHDDAPAASRDSAIIEKAMQLNVCAAACSQEAADSPGLWRHRAALYALQDKPAEAKECEAKAATLPMRNAADYYWLASDHLSAGRLREALPLLHEATIREPRNFWAWFVQGNCYDRLSIDVEAKASYGTCIALKPDFVWAHFNRGLALLRKQEFRAACTDFDTVLTMRPNLADAYLNRALARQGLQQNREAETDLTKALECGGPSRLYFLRARVRDKLGDKAGAQSDLEAGLKTPPADEKSWVARGFYLLNRDPKAALADFEQALLVNPRSADALQNKAHVLAEKLGRNQDALAVLNRALEFYPDSVQARSGRGVLYARLGQREPALRDAEETLRRDSSPPRLYQVACIYALTSKDQPDDRLQAFKLLSSSLRQGYGFNFLDSDDDLNPLRATPEFHRLVEAALALRTPLLKLKKL